MRRRLLLAATVLAMTGAVQPTSAGVRTAGAPGPQPADGPVAAVLAAPVDRVDALQAAAKAVGAYYSSGGGATSDASWRWTPFFMAVLELARETGDPTYGQWLQSWGTRNAWNPDAPASPTSNPDSRAAIQVWEALPSIGITPDLTRSDALMAADLALPASRYWWIDAMFMGLPLWPTWTARTGDPAYAAKAGQFYSFLKTDGHGTYRTGCTTPGTGLFDPTENLWWRDCLYVPRRDSLGHKVFWARGNGWVIAALARMLALTPSSDPRRSEYQAMFQRMAARLVQLQGSDGMWRSSLLSPSLYPAPETSGTALITAALAYGVRAGLLDRSTYLPAVTSAWRGLRTLSLQDSGFVSGCQGVGEAPGAPSSTETTPFCVGAFGLAAVEVARLDPTVARDSFTRTVTGGLGAAQVGGAWSVGSPASAYSVTGGEARFSTPAGTARSASLRTASSTDTDATVTVRVPRPGSGTVTASLVGRRSASTDYRARVVVASTGAVQLQLRRTDSTAIATAAVPGLTVTTGDSLKLRMQAVGASPTTLRAKTWRAGTTEPAWQLTATDSTAALQSAGGVGLASSVTTGAGPSPAIVSFDDLDVRPTGTVLAQDTFSRSSVDGLGVAPVGGAWTPTGPAADFSVSGGAASVRAARGATRTAALQGVSALDTDLRTTFSLPRPSSGSTYVSLLARRVAAGDYRARVVVKAGGAVQLQLRRAGTGLVGMTVPGLTYVNGDRLVLRLRLQGAAPAVLRAKAWKSGAVEPRAWQLVTQDATSGLQAAGSVGLQVYAGSTTSPTPTTVVVDSFDAAALP